VRVSLIVESEHARCEYRTCQMIATAVLIIELGRAQLERRLCDRHHRHAKAIARQRRAVAYRLIPL